MLIALKRRRLLITIYIIAIIFCCISCIVLLTAYKIAKDADKLLSYPFDGYYFETNDKDCWAYAPYTPTKGREIFIDECNI